MEIKFMELTMKELANQIEPYLNCYVTLAIAMTKGPCRAEAKRRINWIVEFR